jgi:putative membrane protein
MAGKEHRFRSEPENVFKGVTAGLIGGLVASWVMEEFQAAWLKLSEAFEEEKRTAIGNTGEQTEQTLGAKGDDSVTQQGQDQTTKSDKAEDEPATVKAAIAISQGLFGHKLTKDEKKVAGPAVHYALGTAVGGLYGGLAEAKPAISSGVGLPFGTIFWLVVDETAVPLLGLSKGPTAYPLSTHVYALASHLVYGATTDIVRRSVRSVL